MAKKTVKPTVAEREIIDRQLKKKYPHMFKETWVSRLKKDVRKELKKQRSEQARLKTTVRGRQVTEQLKRAGLTEKEIAKFSPVK